MNTRSTSAQTGFAQALADSMTPKFAVSYLRVSTRGQAERGGGADEGFSIPAQREANKRKAHSMGAIIGKEFVDRGASARSADRPELQKMLEYIRENRERIDYDVIVHKVDRLARNRGDDVDITRALREADVQLVSASESIDNTPSGMLLHGIMSSIAEFYSQNLATEVKKGMDQKVKGGGYIGKAPLGYINVRRIDDRGREERTVEMDEERAPLVKQAFEEYASGQWTVQELADHLALRGLTSRATPAVPSGPITRGALNKILINPFYMGVVVYKGVEYKGKHPPLIDEETWRAVQDVLNTHLNGERTREHPHFLKGTVYCGNCKSRMIITNCRSRSGAMYPYFICSGRHGKRVKDCKQPAVLIEEVERCVERIYEEYSLQPEIRAQLETFMTAEIENSRKESEAERADLRREKEKLEHKRKKLLEAHYADAIPLDLMKSEQEQIGKALAAIEQQLRAYDTDHETVTENLNKAFELIEDCGQAYRLADEHIKRMFNQVLFKAIWIESDGKVTAELAEPFHSMIQPVHDDIVRYNAAKARGSDSLADYLAKIQNHVQNFFGRGLNKVQIARKTYFDTMNPLVHLCGAIVNLRPQKD